MLNLLTGSASRNLFISDSPYLRIYASKYEHIKKIFFKGNEFP